MAQLAVGDLGDSATAEHAYSAPFCSTTGEIKSAPFTPDGYSLWAIGAVLRKGSTLRWGDQHGDEAIYVRSGTIRSDERRADGGGAMIVEADVPAVIEAETDAEIYHFGPSSPNQPIDGLLGPPERDDHRVHVLGSEGAWTWRREGATNHVDIFGDSHCKTCRLNLFRGTGPDPHHPTSHTHSQDEIILVLEGEVRIGRTRLSPGMCVAVPSNYRYGVMMPGKYRFLNYRRDVSMFTAAPGSEPFIEFPRPEGVE